MSLLLLFPVPNSVVTLGVSKVSVKAAFDRGCSNPGATVPRAANSRLFIYAFFATLMNHASQDVRSASQLRKLAKTYFRKTVFCFGAVRILDLMA